MPCLKSKEQFVTNLRRWWYVTTDRGYLNSSASRRNSWKVLLPVPGILAMLADRGMSNLVILDVYATVALFLVGYLPPRKLWSDLAIFLVHAVFYTAHSILAFRQRQVLQEDDPDAFLLADSWSCQVLSVFGMASAGVHSFALLGFNAFVAAASHWLHQDGGPEQIVACLYVTATAVFAERRVAQLVFDVQGADFGYKALKFTGDPQTDSGQETWEDSPRRATDPLMPKDNEAALTGRPDVVLHSDGEEPESPPASLQGAEPAGNSRSMIADFVLSQLKPKETSRRPSRAEEIFSRLQPVFSSPRPRFAAAQVQMPAAATHEAPIFVDKLEIGDGQLGGLHDSCYSLYSPSAPSTARSSQGEALRFPFPTNAADAERGRLSSTMSSPPVSPPTASARPQHVVLRGIKMHGFSTPQLNVLFIEGREASTKVNGRETYWTEANDYFLYYSKATDTWGLAKARRFQAVIDGTSNGVAHSPEGYEIWEDANGRKRATRTLGNWREWDNKAGKWMPRANSGIEHRGKVRPKVVPLEKAVQTDVASKDQQCQTDR